MLELNTKNKEKIHVHTSKILAHPIFASSPRQQRFLEYLVKHTIDGNANSLKGFTIGVEVFDKNEDFDPSVDSIVRVEAMRLRNKLREYYEQGDDSDEVQINFRKGSYALDFNVFKQPAQYPDFENKHYPEVVTSKPSVVVLPFVSISADASRDYFADGITCSLISLLSRLSGLFIISRQSSFAYKDTGKTSKEIAKELGVQFLLEGSIQHAGDRVRIAAHLVKAHDNTHIWSERYDRELTDIFALQDALTQQIANALQVQLRGEEEKIFGIKDTNSVEAYDILLRAIAIHYTYSKETIKQAIELFYNVVALDENYVAAHAWLARTLAFMWSMHWDRTPSILDSANYHASRALELDPDSPYANSILGWVSMWSLQEESSIFYCKKAVSLDPNNAEALLFLSMTLSTAGYGEEALINIEKAMRFTPTSAPVYEYAMGNCYFVLKEYEKALAAYDRGIELNTNFIPNHYGQIFTFAKLGLQQEIDAKLAINEDLKKLVELEDKYGTVMNFLR